MELRPVRLQDYEDFCRLMAEVDAQHAQAEPRYFKMAGDPPRTKAYFESLLADPQRALFLAWLEGKAAGCIHLEVREASIPILQPMRVGHVSTLVVASSQRRRGLGRALMAEARRWAKDKGCKDLALNVWGFNSGAIDFYEREGFKLTSQNMALPLE